MFESARLELGETILPGDPPDVIDAKVAEAAAWLGEEQQAALWLYAWSLAAGRRRSPASARGPYE